MLQNTRLALESVVEEVTQIHPEFMRTFKLHILSGDHIQIQETLAEGAGFIREYISRRPELSTSDGSDRGLCIVWVAVVALAVYEYVALAVNDGVGVNVSIVANAFLWTQVTTPWDQKAGEPAKGDYPEDPQGQSAALISEKLVAELATTPLWIWEWLPNMKYQGQQFYTSAPWDIRTGDFNGDGKIDRLYYDTRDGANKKFYIFTSTGAQWTYTIGLTSVTPVIGDFDGNGYADILWRGQGSQQQIWYFQSTTVQLVNHNHLDNQTYYAVAGDFNGDRVDDVLWYGVGTAPDDVWLGAYNKTTNTVQVPPINDYAVPLVGRFFSSALDPFEITDDVVFYKNNQTTHTLWDVAPSTGTTLSISNWIVQTSAVNSRPFVADFDANGYDDIYWYQWSSASSTDDVIWTWFGPSWTVWYNFGQGTNWFPRTGDLLHRGYPDIIWWPYPGRASPPP